MKITSSEPQQLEPHQQSELITATKLELLKLERIFDAHYALTLNEMQVQKEPLDRMCALSQRYLTVAKTETSPKQTQIEVAAYAADFLLQEFNETLKLLQASCSRMVGSLEPLIVSYKAFKQLYDELDSESIFLSGGTQHKPIVYFIEQADAFAAYFSNLIIKFNYRRKLLDIEDAQTLSDYRALLVPSQNFEEVFHVALADMKCLRQSSAAALEGTH